MAINADTLLDRLYLKSQITKWRMLALLFAIMTMIIATERNNPRSPIEKDFIARFSIEGVIGDNQKVYDLIADLEDNPKAKAVVLWLDTPGGSAVGGEEMYLKLRELAKKKPVVAVMRSISASAGYMVALGADHIFAREGTITGSIGVIVEAAEVSELAEKLGIKPIIVRSAPLKGTPSPFEKASPESIRVLQTIIDDFYGRFIDMVAERRQLPRETVVTLADGRVFSGKRALQNKLIDAIGGEQDAVNWLVTEKKVKQGLEVKDVEIAKEKSWLSQLDESIAGKFFQTRSVGLDGLVAIWHPQLH